jgi:uncharacterized phage-associated protein
MKNKVRAIDVTAYLLKSFDDAVSNKYIQNLLYYAQGFNLAFNNERLFNDLIIKYPKGPRVRYIHLNCPRVFIDSYIPISKIERISYNFNNKKKEVIDEVFEVYGQFTNWKLQDLISEEPPFKDTEVGKEISLDKMREYFLTQVEDEDEGI